MRRDCSKCGTAFDAARGTSRYCDACRFAKCEECAATFVHPGPGRPGRFCSLGCRSAFRFRGRRVVVACDRCDVVVSVPLSRREKREKIFCSRRCRSLYYWSDVEARAKLVAGLKASPSIHSAARRAQLDEARKLCPRDEAWRAKIRSARMRQTFPTKMTGIEQTLHDAFIAAGLAFEMHRTMFGRWQPDFVFAAERVIVQADGDYWHSRPKAVANDARFDAAAKTDGWTVLRFLGSRIQRDAGACVREVVTAMQGHRISLPA